MTHCKTFLFIFAHPDDETTSSGGTMAKLVRQGHTVYVCTATKGEEGSLGSGGFTVKRSDLPRVREQELREALDMYGTEPPIFLGYKDKQLELIGQEELEESCYQIMNAIVPDFLITFGPSGISQHPDHIAVHKSATAAFHAFQSHHSCSKLFYIAIPDRYNDFDLNLSEIERNPDVIIDITDEFNLKVAALRNYKSQEDAQFMAKFFELNKIYFEAYSEWNVADTPSVRDQF